MSEAEVFEKKIKEIDEQINIIDSQISKLQITKKKLLHAKEELKDKKYFDKSTELANNDWAQETYPWSKNVKEKLQSVFGVTSFRQQQLETINATMSKQDVILVAPTGGGKSLTFQLPAVCENGLTLVVSPLIGLMEDQLYGLRKKGINAEMLCSTTDKEVMNRVHNTLSDASLNCPLKLLYVTPERLAKSKRLLSCLQKCHKNKKLERIAIDEVHCCSSWGHDFRTDYKFLSSMKISFPNVPIIGVTATASRKVLLEVQKMLNIRESLIFCSPFNRPNLYYHVMEKPSENEATYDLLADLLLNRYNGGSGIIYTFSIKDTETITSELLQRNVKVRPYHASLEPHQRSKTYTQWMANEIQAVVATIAFGMGIDKPDLRFVIHHTMPKSIEGYYQESGRAGRDGSYAECLILYSFKDIFKLSTMNFTEMKGLDNVYSMVKYCIDAKKCRRDLLAKYFSEVWNDRNCSQKCDHCFHKRSVIPPKMEISNYYRTLVKIIDHAQMLDIKVTGLKMIDSWFHKGASNLRLENSAPPAIDRYFAEQIVAFLITNGYLKEDFHYTAYSTISYIQRGHVFIEDDELEYQAARVLKLPSAKEVAKLQTSFESVSDNNAEVSFVSESKSPIRTKKRTKRHISESTNNSSSDDDDVVLDKDLNNLIKKKVKSQIAKYFELPGKSSTASPSTNIKSEKDDDVVLLSPKDEIINID